MAGDVGGVWGDVGGVEPGQGIDLHLYFADVGDHCVK